MIVAPANMKSVEPKYLDRTLSDRYLEKYQKPTPARNKWKMMMANIPFRRPNAA